MFRVASAWNGDISGWDFSNVGNTSYMFDRCYEWTGTGLTSMDFSNVQSALEMFAEANKLTGDPSSLNFESAVDLTGLFRGLSGLNVTIDGDMVAFGNHIGNNTLAGAKVSLNTMFFNTNASSNPFASINTRNWNIENVSQMSQTFRGFTEGDVDTELWDVSNVTDLTSCFNGYTGADLDVSNWVINTAGSVIMDGIFSYTTNCDPDLTGWNMDKVSVFNNAGFGATGLTAAQYGLNLNAWDTGGYNALTTTWNIEYPASAATARANLITAGWTITDNGPL
jgi:hypothetical protein